MVEPVCERRSVVIPSAAADWAPLRSMDESAGRWVRTTES
jgi:hypothetical protein